MSSDQRHECIEGDVAGLDKPVLNLRYPLFKLAVTGVVVRRFRMRRSHLPWAW